MLMRAFGEEYLRAQRLEGISPADPVHHANEVVERFRVRIRDWMIEVRQNLVTPIPPRCSYWRERTTHRLRDPPFPKVVAPLRLDPVRRIVDREEISFSRYASPSAGCSEHQLSNRNRSCAVNSCSRFSRMKRSCINPRRCRIGSDARRPLRICSSAVFAIRTT